MIGFEAALAALAWFGHTALAVASFNRLHGLGIDRGLRRRLELALFALYLGTIGIYFVSCGLFPIRPTDLAFFRGPFDGRAPYFAIALIAAAMVVPYRLLPQWLRTKPAALAAHRTDDFNLAAEGPIPVFGTEASILSRLPGNQIFRLRIEEKRLRLPNLPAAWEGLTIAHLSVLHFTGDLGYEYFERAFALLKRRRFDAIVLSGDIVESTACLDWIASFLGDLSAPCGKYFILGNHDLRMPDVASVRTALRDHEWIDLGARCVRSVWRGVPIHLVGTESPWFAGPQESEMRAFFDRERAFRLLVSHSPDQLAFARRFEFPLMLAGHNHGGQIRVPLWGPIISPSLHGVRYAGGLFYETPTLLHVSRGLSGEHPIRWNCPPEIALLTFTG